MAIFGFGASYDREDVSASFVGAGAACVGWLETDAPPLGPREGTLVQKQRFV